MISGLLSLFRVEELETSGRSEEETADTHLPQLSEHRVGLPHTQAIDVSLPTFYRDVKAARGCLGIS